MTTVFDKPAKPPGCTCSYPDVVARNGVGHTAPCPYWERHPFGGGLAQRDDPRRVHERDTRERGPVPPSERRPG
jgi:hypothetical protein